MLKISWTERMRNEEALRRVVTKREIRKMIRRRLLRFVGHTKSLQQLESVYVTGKVEGSVALISYALHRLHVKRTA